MNEPQDERLARPPHPGRHPPRRPAKIVQFGDFELRTDTGELRKSGVRIRLQAKPLQVLLALLEHPGEVVKREDLRYRLWPVNTFVDFESGMNTAANRLRLALGDSADVPRYIETLPRIGYRFIAPARELPAGSSTSPAESLSASPVVPAEWDAVAKPAQPSLTDRWLHPVSLWITCGLTVLLLGFLIWRGVLSRTGATGPGPEYRQLTFASGDVTAARFAPDGSTVVYSRADAGESRIYAANARTRESRALDFRNATLAAVSSAGELAVLNYNQPSAFAAVLIRAPMNGGPAREVARDVISADWAPDGQRLALIRFPESGPVLEFPAGKVVLKCNGWGTSIRVSPSGTRVAFLEHPKWADDAGHVRLLDAGGAARVLSSEWASADGLAWSPAENEIWFTASKAGIQRSLYAVTLDGKTRMIAAVPGELRLLDISRLGHVLLCRDDDHMSISAMLPGSRRAEELPGFDYSQVNDISRDGNLVLATESGNAGGSNYSIYIHDHRAHANTRIGHGQALALSPDQRYVLALNIRDQTSLALLPLGAVDQKTISGAGLHYQNAAFFPDGRRLLVTGSFPGQPAHLYIQPIDGGPPKKLNTSVCLRLAKISPDGKFALGTCSGMVSVLNLQTLALEKLPASLAAARPVGWTSDGRVLLSTGSGSTWTLIRADIAGAHTEVLASFTPPDLTGRVWISGVAATPDGAWFAYSYAHDLSSLYLVDGWLNASPAAKAAYELLRPPVTGLYAAR